MRLAIIKQVELHLADRVGGNDMKYEKPNMELLEFEEKDIITDSLGEGDQEKEYPNQW